MAGGPVLRRAPGPGGQRGAPSQTSSPNAPPTPRFREEMYGDLGHLMWSFFAFLWRFVTLFWLLSLLIMYLMSLYWHDTSHYIAWNSSLVRRPTLPSHPHSGGPRSDLPPHRTLDLCSYDPQGPPVSPPAPGESDPPHHTD